MLPEHAARGGSRRRAAVARRALALRLRRALGALVAAWGVWTLLRLVSDAAFAGGAARGRHSGRRGATRAAYVRPSPPPPADDEASRAWRLRNEILDDRFLEPAEEA